MAHFPEIARFCILSCVLRTVICLVLLPGMLIARQLPAIPAGKIARYQMITEGLYRGGQPHHEGFRFLKQQGFKTVINLRIESDEAEVVQGLGMNYVQIPIGDLMPWSKIPRGAIAKYFEIVNDPANYPIFFHCRRGADRTGAMAAFYRIAVQGWDASKAYSEARDAGMRWWFPALKRQVHGFRPAPARTTAGLAQER